jgi:hypothetical protein
MDSAARAEAMPAAGLRREVFDTRRRRDPFESLLTMATGVRSPDLSLVAIYIDQGDGPQCGGGARAGFGR